ncbi:hypothetical protein J7T55_013544 [Diaporthe amygdali]|uniref:uncharacterized protein n=1 Tax=Phomopsis amygdali TaxID=1214568 RepID=UPI0022FECE64|nr:uncharacterized protein J7T55_013544 [Diaporthe amygdali]KAJ0119306.1 hypothetical protein J7T55_013544 [Diaporthe amygdali]
MSPIVARAAIRASTQAQATRQFSVMRTMRNMARSFEPHPFQRLPINSSTQGASWGKQVKRVGSQAVIYTTGFGIILGWPYAAAQVLDGRIGAL